MSKMHSDFDNQDDSPSRSFFEALSRDPRAAKKWFPYLHNDMSKFVAGTTPIFYSGPFWDAEEIQAAVGALLFGQWLSAGEAVRKFETEFARRLGQKSALMVNSGSSANLVMATAAKRRFGWNDGDEILVSVVGFPTTPTPFLQNGLKTVFVDIELDSLNFDLDLLEAAAGPRTKAVLVSPVLGNPPDFDRLADFCRRKDLVLLLDDCDSLGTTWNGELLNRYAFASTNSFYSSHHLCTGEGGMVVSDDAEFMKIARSIAWWGRDCTCVGSANLLKNGSCGERFKPWLAPHYEGVIDHRYVFTEMGYNLKPLDLQGAIGSVQLGKFDRIHELRKRSYQRISESFRRHLDVVVPKALPQADVSWFGVPAICRTGAQKTALVQHLESARIQTRNCFAGNLLVQPGFRHLGDHKDFPNADQVLERVFFVGAAPHYTDDVFAYVDSVLETFAGA